MLFDTGFEGPCKTVLPTYIPIVGVVTIRICEARCAHTNNSLMNFYERFPKPDPKYHSKLSHLLRFINDDLATENLQLLHCFYTAEIVRSTW